MACQMCTQAQELANSALTEAEFMAQSRKLYISSLLSGNVDDVQQAVHCAHETLDLMPSDVLSRPDILYNLARPLLRRFLQTRQVQDITKAIEMLQRASELLVDKAVNDSLLCKCYNYLAICYFVRDGNLDVLPELNAPDVSSQSITSLQIETILLSDLGEENELFRYVVRKMLECQLPPQPRPKDVDSAIQLARQALKFFSFPSSDPAKISLILLHLGTLLSNDESIDCFYRALALALPIRSFPSCLTCASIWFRNRFEVLGEDEALDNAEDLAKRAMTMYDAVENAQRAMGTFTSRDTWFRRCRDNLERIMSYRDRAAKEVNDMTPTMDTEEGNNSEVDLPVLAVDLRLRVRRATNSAEEAQLEVRSKKLYISCLVSDSLNDIQQAVHCAEEVFALMPPAADVPLRPDILYNLARPLFQRFLHTRQIQDITLAIDLFRYVHHLLPHDDPVRLKCQDYVIVSYIVRDCNLDIFPGPSAPGVHIQSISIETALVFNLDAAGEVADYLCTTMGRSPPEPGSKDEDSVIQLCRQALKRFSPRNESHQTWKLLSLLGKLLDRRYYHRTKLEDNDEALDCYLRALRLQVPTVSFGESLSSASEAFQNRFDALGKREDLDNAEDHAKQAVKVFHAINLAKQAIQIFDANLANFVMCLDRLASVTFSRYKNTGEMNNLNAAIGIGNRAIEIAEREVGIADRAVDIADSNRCRGDFPKMLRAHDIAYSNRCKIVLPRLLNNLASLLVDRCHRTGQIDDLKVAVEMLQRAVDALKPKDSGRTQMLVNLSTLEKELGSRLSDKNLEKEALQHFFEAFSTEDFGLNPGPDLFVVSGLAVFRKEDAFLDEKSSKEVIRWAKLGTSPTLANHPTANISHSILCDDLHARWRRTHDINDLDEAISTARSMIEVAENGANDSIWGRSVLGELLYDRYKCTRDDENRKGAVDVLLEGFYMSAGAPQYRIKAALPVIDIFSEGREWKRAHELSLEIVDLLVILNGRSLDWRDKQDQMRQFSHLAPVFASIAIEAESDVLDVIDILETCRGSILGHVIDSRTDLDDLLKVAPEKAECFRTLQNEITTVIDSSASRNSRLEQITRRGEADVNIRACLEDIRKLDGFHRFLLGPTRNELHEAAARGPILIVNVSLRSDAIIITEKDLVLLPLPELKYQEAAKYLEADLTNFSDIKELGNKNRKYPKLQKWLWDNCIKLIFNKLDDLGSGSAKLHVWWIGTGLASFLPFHAAGIYTGNLHETVLTRAISSYTPTLKILIHGRKKLKNDRLTSKPEKGNITPRVAIIIMPSTPGNDDLERVQEEAEKIEIILGDTYKTQTIKNPSAEDTRALMAGCEVAHFACHGLSIEKDPSSSHLLLQAINSDSKMPVIDKLQVRDVAATDLSHGKLAFLSACSTAEISPKGLPDQILHLASGFQVAGYLHAVGNLWKADDEVCPQLVEGFYQHLVAAGAFGDGQNVAKALNEAVIDIAKQEEYARQPLSWASFVHFGV